MHGCLEAQIGAVTGGARGHKIPKAVKEALEEIRSTRGPRGKFKDAIDGLQEVRVNVAELETKRKDVFKYMEDLTRGKRELKELQTGWNEEDHHVELDAERGKRTAAATRAAEIESAKSTAGLARERATRAQQLVEDRAKLVAEIVPIETQITGLQTDLAKALTAKTDAQSSVEAGEKVLTELRSKASRNGERSRHLERVRSAVALDAEIKEHKSTLDKAVTLEKEISQLSEAVGQIAATDEAVRLIEEAVTEMSASESAVNAVATTVTFAIDQSAQKRVSIDAKPLTASSTSLPVIGKTVIAIDEIGTITIEPQIRNRNGLLVRQREARDGLKAALDAADVKDLAAARTAAAQRKEHERRLAEVRREIAGLAPGSRPKKLAVGLDALRNYVSELRGRLKAELEKLAITAVPDSAQIEQDIRKNHTEGAHLVTDIESAEAALAGPQDSSSQAGKTLQKVQERLAGLNGTFATKKADLDAGRASATDEQLAAGAETLEREAADKKALLSELEKNQGESPETIDARIKRLEGATTNHHRAVAELGNEVIRLTTLIEANEGAGIEELLAVAEAEQHRLASNVADFEQETAVLKLLSDTLETAEREAKTRYLAPVVSRVEPYLKMLIPGAGLVLDEDLHITAIERDGLQEEFGCLSDGTQEQLAVLARIAFAELLLKQGRPATVILDDALAFSDDQRIESMFDILMRAGEQVQIIVLTCRKRLFTRLGASPLQIQEERTGS
ncbi:MAG: hypothetical protein WAV72_25820, partial [Bradyrhizobium sp.]